VVFRTQNYIPVVSDSLAVILITTTTCLTDGAFLSTPYKYYLDRSCMFLRRLLPYIISGLKSKSR